MGRDVTASLRRDRRPAEEPEGEGEEGETEGGEPALLGQRFIDSEEYKAAEGSRDRQGRRYHAVVASTELEHKNLTSIIGSGAAPVLNANGQPSTSAYGLGQITRGTAEQAVRGGYLPATFDRTDPSQGAAGIAGVFQMKLDQAGGDQFKALKNFYGSKDDGANTAYANDVLRRAGQMDDPSAIAQGRDVDTTKLADTLLSTFTDSLASSLFGSLTTSGGGGGFPSSLFRGGSTGPSLSSLPVLEGTGGTWFAKGGIMTSRGPVPINAYANGGVANSPQMAAPANGNSAPQKVDNSRSYSIEARGAQAGVADQIVKAIRQYDAEKTRTQLQDREMARRAFGQARRSG